MSPVKGQSHGKVFEIITLNYEAKTKVRRQHLKISNRPF
jgi:hypothetical protein